MNNLLIKLYASLKRLSFLPGGIKIWTTSISFIFLGYSIYLNSSSLNQIEVKQADLYLFLFGIILSLISLFINAYAWKSLIKWFDVFQEDLYVIPLYINTNLLKYIPGGIWHFIERLRIIKRFIGIENAMAVVFLEPLIMCASALFLVAITDIYNGYKVLFLIPSILLFRRFREPLLKRFSYFKTIKIGEISSEILFQDDNRNKFRLSKQFPSLPFLNEIVFIIFRFGGFICCLKMFSNDFDIDYIYWLSNFSLAWALGLIVPGAPGGVGIFESIILIGSKSDLPIASLLATLLFYRLGVSITDLISPIFIATIRKVKNF